MPMDKLALTMENPPEETAFYMAKVSTKKLRRVEDKRNRLGMDKKGVIDKMMDLFLKTNLEAK